MSEGINRYSRQVSLEAIGEEGQQRIRNARILIVGCGALGSMAAMELAGAGIGVIGIADFDTVDISNLQRQFFYATENAGILKSQLLAAKITALNPEVTVEIYNDIITEKKARCIFGNFDFIIDATDNPESKKMIGGICMSLGKPCSIGGVGDFHGQVMTLLPDDPRFEDYFGESGSEGFMPCSLGGVFGPAAVVCASIQASEALKYIVNAGELLSRRLLCFNLLNNTFQKFSL